MQPQLKLQEPQADTFEFATIIASEYNRVFQTDFFEETTRAKEYQVQKQNGFTFDRVLDTEAFITLDAGNNYLDGISPIQIGGAIEPGSKILSFVLTDIEGNSINVPSDSIIIENGRYSVKELDYSSLADGRIRLDIVSIDSYGNICKSN